MITATAPVITLDGPSGVGKGTVTSRIAHRLGFKVLDSGAIYRGTAWAAARSRVPSTDIDALIALIKRTKLVWEPESDAPHERRLWCDGKDITDAIRNQECGHQASIISAINAVRKALFNYQRQYQVPPGLVADGRDMGTVVFPQAELKIFLDADIKERAYRRFRQLRSQGMGADFDATLKDLQQRDRRDQQRLVAPLQAAKEAITMDTTSLTIDEVVSVILHHAAQRGIHAAR